MAEDNTTLYIIIAVITIMLSSSIVFSMSGTEEVSEEVPLAQEQLILEKIKPTSSDTALKSLVTSEQERLSEQEQEKKKRDLEEREAQKRRDQEEFDERLRRDLEEQQRKLREDREAKELERKEAERKQNEEDIRLKAEEADRKLKEVAKQKSLENYTQLVNQDAAGNDIQCFTDGSSVDKCRELCDEHRDCVAFNRIESGGVWGEKSGCCYKNSTHNLVPVNPNFKITFWKMKAKTLDGPVIISNNWTIADENGVLVIRNISNPTDARYAFFQGKYVDIGTPQNLTTNAIKTYRISKDWSIQEESGGVLVFRNTSSKTDSRYAFFPNNYVDVPGSASPQVAHTSPLKGKTVQGPLKLLHWSIQDENGVLVIRHVTSAKDSRIALFPNIYRDL